MIVIVDTGANLVSIFSSLERLGMTAKLTRDAGEIKSASHVILPGVGTAKVAMEKIKELGLFDTLRSLTQPVFGICLGMQLLYEFSEEGHVSCLGIVPEKVKKLQAQPGLAVPHMGWNQIIFSKDSPLFKGIKNNSDVYYVHSYAPPVNEATCAITHYGQDFTAITQKDNFFGVQFHPERSGKVGERIIKNFLEL
jgi:glutamine amidotransferase